MKNRTFFDSFCNAMNGIFYTCKNERNMKIHITVAVLVLAAGFLFRLTKVEFLILCLTIAAVLICEVFNTAMEVFVDLVVDVYHPKVKIIKDVSAGAVWISALAALAIGYLIFFDKIKMLLIGLLNK